ncbi:MAG: phosphodiesterase [Ruminococcaceae bacterium]|nr:phosphodiesterase [Oscillospiraceae bacterium]
MKYVIASDIHGSSFWCERLVESFKKQKADKLILLGDILYHGPRNELPEEYSPKKVIELLNSLEGKVISVRGNCDSEVDEMVLNFPIMSDFSFIMAKEHTVFLTHGHIYNENNLPPLSNGDVLVHGHTHVPICERKENYTIINPGSVAIPKENSHHGYIVFDGDEFVLFDFDENVIDSIKI